MKKERGSFTAEFKLEVARMIIDQGIDVPTVCKDMKLGPTAVRRWVDQKLNKEVIQESASRSPASNSVYGS